MQSSKFNEKVATFLKIFSGGVAACPILARYCAHSPFGVLNV